MQMVSRVVWSIARCRTIGSVHVSHQRLLSSSVVTTFGGTGHTGMPKNPTQITGEETLPTNVADNERKSKAGKLFSSVEMNIVLQEGISKHLRDGWEKVAEYVGNGATAAQCKNRSHYLNSMPSKHTKAHGMWEDQEVRRLEKLVPQHLVPSQWSERHKRMTKEYTDWKTIGALLGRQPVDCASRWRSVLANRLKTGPYTAEEDALIMQRVAEWGDQRSGLWVALEKEMGRSARNILSRHAWLSKYKQGESWSWSAEMDDRLKKGVSLHRHEGWAKVAEYVGGGATESQCRQRWNTYVKVLQLGTVKRGDWSKADVAKLTELVPMHLVASYYSTNQKAMTKEYTNWDAVAAKLHRLAIDCRDKWNSLQCAELKKGRFTAEEDALIRQRVAEWGDKGQGLWVALQKEMGRPANNIQIRYNRWLKNAPASSVDDSGGDGKVTLMVVVC